MLKKTIIFLLCASIISVNTGCFGSFSLTKKLYTWNESLGDKWVQSGVMWLFVIIPVYEACSFIDVVALNLIEFWTGNNPLALNAEKETVTSVVAGDKLYEVTVGKGNIAILETRGPDAGKKVTITLDRSTSSWSLSDGVTSTVVASYNPMPLSTIDLHYPDGRIVSQSLATTETAGVYR